MRRIASFVLLVATFLTVRASIARDIDGVRIIEHNLQATIASELRRPDRDVEMWDVQPRDERVCLDAVEQALSSYPPAFIQALLQRIVLAGDLYVWGRQNGGLQVPGMIAVNCSSASNNVDFIEDTVHQAIAGRVRDVAPPDWRVWQSGNKPGFRYGNFEDYKAELSDPDARAVVRRLNQAGFVSRYGLTGTVGDFETYAEQTFGHGAQFAALVRQYPLMQRKLGLLLQSYLQAAPALSVYFDQTGLASAAGLSPSSGAKTAQARPAPVH